MKWSHSHPTVRLQYLYYFIEMLTMSAVIVIETVVEEMKLQVNMIFLHCRNEDSE